MANENVDINLIEEFEKALIEEGKKYSVVQPTNGHSFALGYLVEMLKSGMFNEEIINERIANFRKDTK